MTIVTKGRLSAWRIMLGSLLDENPARCSRDCHKKAVC